MEIVKAPFEDLTKRLLNDKKLWTEKECKKNLGILSDLRYRASLKSELFDAVSNLLERILSWWGYTHKVLDCPSSAHP